MELVRRRDVDRLHRRIGSQLLFDIQGEARVRILDLIDELLDEAGSEKAKILSATIYLSDISTFAEMNSVWDVWVDKENPPARATVEAKLVTPDYKVEIAVIAAK